MEASSAFAVFIILALLWSIPWKGYALWVSARNAHMWWFIVLLLVNTLAILEIIYIFRFSKRTKKEEDGAELEKDPAPPTAI